MMLLGDQYAKGAQQILQTIVPIERHNTVLHSSSVSGNEQRGYA
jgi:hypothetical protein